MYRSILQSDFFSQQVTRSEILDSVLEGYSSEVRRKLGDTASQSLAHIAIIKSPQSPSNLPDGISSSAGWSGLETVRVCELVIPGSEDGVDLVRVRLLVLLDELVHPKEVSLA